MDFKNKVREIPDWPQKGISFKDITPILTNPNDFKNVINKITKPFKNSKITKVVGIDARGFLLASPVAYKLKAGLAIVRKKGKLPYKTVTQAYKLEYGTNTLQMHVDSIGKTDRVLVVDDVLATGGTAQAACKLVSKLGGKIVSTVFLIELTKLSGAKKLKGYKVFSLIKY